jgi:hypothetical protein
MIQQAVLVALRKYFSPAEVARILKTLPKRSTPIMDLVYPEARRKQKTSSMIALSELADIVGAPPVVRKGTRSYAQDTGSNSAMLIEPEAFVLSRFIKASDLNTLISMGMTSNIQAFAAEQIEGLRNSVRAGTEIMAAQTLSGAINYPMADESGALKNYGINYGTVPSLADADMTSMSYGDIRKILEEIFMAQQERGYSGDVRFLVGGSVYTRILDVVTNLKNMPGQFTPDGLILDGKYKIQPMTITYKKPGAESATPVVADKFITAIDVGAEHTLFYCAIDDMDAGLAPLPLFTKVKESDDPSGLKIIGNSKPIPAPVLSAMTSRKVLA